METKIHREKVWKKKYKYFHRHANSIRNMNNNNEISLSDVTKTSDFDKIKKKQPLSILNSCIQKPTLDME